MPLWILLFLSSAVVFGAGVMVWWQVTVANRQSRMAKSIVANIDPDKVTTTSRVLIDAPAPPGLLARLFKSKNANPAVSREAMANQGKFLLATLGMVVPGVLVGWHFIGTFGSAAPVIVGALSGALPWLHRSRKRKKRLAAIEEQFPEALDFLGRSMHAGNALSIGLELLADELAEPLKTEIVKVTREMAFGASLENALNGLIARVDLVEVRFFVCAILLQKDTGGNLNEIIGKLAISVRERLRLRGQVKAMSGQGRLTAAVLSVLPIVLMIVLKVINPDYLNSLTGDPLGRNLLAGAAVSQIVGFLVMKKIINIDI